MARYIDADKADVEQIDCYYGAHCTLQDVQYWLEEQPTADVVPKSEVDNLEYTLLGVMHFVDKWLDGDELKQHEVNRAATMREKTLRIIETLKTEFAREIFAEIEKIIENSKYQQLNPFGTEERYNPYLIKKQIAELKKKYTEEINNENH